MSAEALLLLIYIVSVWLVAVMAWAAQEIITHLKAKRRNWKALELENERLKRIVDAQARHIRFYKSNF